MREDEGTMKTTNSVPDGGSGERPWMRSFAKLRDLREESTRIERVSKRNSSGLKLKTLCDCYA
jgi:hypothetical protein